MENKISETTIETLTRNFFKESLDYGFKYEDYLRFVNRLLEYAITTKNNGSSNLTQKKTTIVNTSIHTSLPLETENLIIRKFDKENDSKYIMEWMQDEFGKYFLLSMTNSRDGDINKLISSDKNQLGIITLKDNIPIGVVAFLNYDKLHRKAELRKLIGVTKYRGHGYGKEATRHWINYGFNSMNLKKIYLNTIDTNIHNIKINEKMGFRVEGILRNEALVNGVSHDVLRMGLLAEE